MSSSTLPVLRVWVNPAVEGLRSLYEQQVEQHNKHIMSDPHPNSGFDLLIPDKENFVHVGDEDASKEMNNAEGPLGSEALGVFGVGLKSEAKLKEGNKARLVNHQIKAAMYDPNWCRTPTQTSCAYYLYPRSSIYKTPLMLANSVGIIDSGYRGWICSALRYLPRAEDESGRSHDGVFRYAVEKHTKITQICHPNLVPFLVELVDDEAVLESTSRGEGGFGSTGK